jgi:PIN domain nuclease of toxin-antitoxin system
MKLLLDTHVLLWTLFDPSRLGASLKDTLGKPEHQVFASDVSFWEISMKFALGKLSLGTAQPQELPAIVLSAGFSILPIGSDLLASYHLLELPRDRHRDPFDRLLIWQAISSGMTLCTHDHIIRQHSIKGLAVLP